MVPGIECTLPCKSCLGPTQKTSCSSCHPAGTINVSTNAPYLWENECLESCPEGYFADQNNKCQKCHWECKTCADYFTCLSCNEYDDWPFFYDFKCYDECPSATYVDQDNVCQECESPCRECTGPENGECLSCLQTSTNSTYYLDGTTCLKECPVGKLSQNFECKKCTAGCTTCEVTTD